MDLVDEINRLCVGTTKGGRNLANIVISTNLALRNDGFPRADQRTPADVGVAVYFTRNGKNQCFACDKYDAVWKNMRAISKTIEAMRGIERWGSSEMMDRAFSGFVALPAPGKRPWWEVLAVDPRTSKDVAKIKFRELAKVLHPDTATGSEEAFKALNEAYEESQR